MSGYYLVYKYQRRQVRLEMKAFLRKKETGSNVQIEKFTFKLSQGKVVAEQFEWMNDHEFSYKGEMYDIVNSDTVNDSLRVECVNDETETLLVKKFESLFKKEAGNPVKGNAALIQLAHSVYLEPGQEYSFTCPATISVVPSGWLSRFFDSYSGDIKVPPPQAV